MKVYIITNIGFPNGLAPGNRIKCYAKAILHAGIDCEVIIYRRTERYGYAPKNTDGEGVYEGISFKYIAGTPLRGRNVFIRRFNDYKDKLKLRFYLKSVLKENDIVFAYSGHDVKYNIAICKLVHELKAKYITELCELPYGTSKETSSTIRNRHIVESKLLPIVDGVIPISESLKEYAQQFVNAKCCIQKIPIMVDFEKCNLENKSDEAECPYIFHSGALTEQKDGILGVIEAFGIAAQKLPEIRYLLTGNLENSQYAKRITELLSEYNIKDRVIFLGYLTDDKLRDYLAHASLTIINKYRTQQNKYCFATKLGEYMAAGKPVITTNVGESQNWLSNEKNAYIVEAENVKILAETIIKAFENPTERKAIGECARQTCNTSFYYTIYSEILKKYCISLSDENFEFS